MTSDSPPERRAFRRRWWTEGAHVRFPVSGMHPVELFSQLLADLPAGDYPPGIDPIPGMLRGTAFFPGAAGLYWPDPWTPLPSFPHGGVMFVGNNVDGTTSFLERLGAGEPHGDPRSPRRLMATWRNLYRLLDRAGIEPQHCYFTNAHVGTNARGTTGTLPADRIFRQWCARFLRTQIAVMEPRLVVTLGRPAQDAVARADIEHVSVSHPSRVLSDEVRTADASTIRRALAAIR